MKHMILSSKMEKGVIFNHFLMLWFQKDSLHTVGCRTYGGGSRVPNQKMTFAVTGLGLCPKRYPFFDGFPYQEFASHRATCHKLENCQSPSPPWKYKAINNLLKYVSEIWRSSEWSQNYYLGIGAGDRVGHWKGIGEGGRAGLGLDHHHHQDQGDETESHLKIIHSPSMPQKLPNIFCIQNRYRFPPKCSKQMRFSMKSLQQ